MSLYFSDDIQRFLGNQTHVDFFKLLRQDGDSLLIGARNVVFNISLRDMAENRDRVSSSTNGAQQSESRFNRSAGKNRCHFE